MGKGKSKASEPDTSDDVGFDEDADTVASECAIYIPGPPDREVRKIHIGGELEILGQRWSVRVEPPWDPSILGCCDYQSRTIRIRDGMDGSLTIETWMHEVLHACLTASGIDHEESMVNSLAPVLLDCLCKSRARFS